MALCNCKPNEAKLVQHSVVGFYRFFHKIYSFSDAPQLWLSLGQNLAEDKIKEGDDVYFDCEINANPKTGKITWKHNVSVCMESSVSSLLDNILCGKVTSASSNVSQLQGEIIKSSAENGFRMNKGNLIIQNVKRSSAGEVITLVSLEFAFQHQQL